MSERLTPEQEDELQHLAVADTVPLHMRQRLLAALAELDRLRQRVADLTAGLLPFARLGREPKWAERMGDPAKRIPDEMAPIQPAKLEDCRAAARLLAEDQK
jgi:hypothetical protein